MIDEYSLLKSIWYGSYEFNPYQMRYYCSLIARFGIYCGLSDEVICEVIFKWASMNGMTVKLFVKGLVAEERRNYREINAETFYISKAEAEYVIRTFKKKNSRKLALGILLYAKMTGQYDIVELPVFPFAEWMGHKNANHLYERYIRELVDAGFINDEDISNKWHGNLMGEKRTKTIRLNVELDLESKDFPLINNDLDDLLKRILLPL